VTEKTAPLGGLNSLTPILRQALWQRGQLWRLMRIATSHEAHYNALKRAFALSVYFPEISHPNAKRPELPQANRRWLTPTHPM
jgi:hypothetical protein